MPSDSAQMNLEIWFPKFLLFPILLSGSDDITG